MTRLSSGGPAKSKRGGGEAAELAGAVKSRLTAGKLRQEVNTSGGARKYTETADYEILLDAALHNMSLS